ncbi:MAG: hypothetical protein ICV85_10700 [Tolypothrix sp. T3-bin4]|nr:hypothetical protein [Tolypothrix sp. T3-bin4]
MGKQGKKYFFFLSLYPFPLLKLPNDGRCYNKTAVADSALNPMPDASTPGTSTRHWLPSPVGDQGERVTLLRRRELPQSGRLRER